MILDALPLLWKMGLKSLLSIVHKQTRAQLFEKIAVMINSRDADGIPILSALMKYRLAFKGSI